MPLVTTKLTTTALSGVFFGLHNFMPQLGENFDDYAEDIPPLVGVEQAIRAIKD
jgi:ABC-type uncharacterized transport system permease subunit